MNSTTQHIPSHRLVGPVAVSSDTLLLVGSGMPSSEFRTRTGKGTEANYRAVRAVAQGLASNCWRVTEGQQGRLARPLNL